MTTAEHTRYFIVDGVGTVLGPLREMSEQYYRECELARAASVEVQLPDQIGVVISATRYHAPEVSIDVIETEDGLRVVGIGGAGPVVLREFPACTRYKVCR